MADGLNDARAMRIAEVMTDYQSYQTALYGYQSMLSQVPEGSTGHVVLRQCLAEANALLMVSFSSGDVGVPTSPGEGTKAKLQRILLDASSRRFRAVRLYERAGAAVRWIQQRNQVLQGKQPTPQNQQILSQIDNALRQGIIAVTDARVFQQLLQMDTSKGNWTAEMPSLQRIQQFITIQN